MLGRGSHRGEGMRYNRTRAGEGWLLYIRIYGFGREVAIKTFKIYASWIPMLSLTTCSSTCSLVYGSRLPLPSCCAALAHKQESEDSQDFHAREKLDIHTIYVYTKITAGLLERLGPGRSEWGRRIVGWRGRRGAVGPRSQSPVNPTNYCMCWSRRCA